jgi:hypothetical protein
MFVSLILKRTMTGLIADWAIERVIDEQKFKRVFLRTDYRITRAMGLDHHAIGHVHRATGLQLGHELDDRISVIVQIGFPCLAVHLRHAHIYQTLPAVGRSGHRWMVAEMRQIDAIIQAELE